MKNSKYYLIAANGAIGKVVKVPSIATEGQGFFKDISMLDLVSMDQSKEEFIKSISLYNEGISLNNDTDLFVLRIANSTENLINLHTYELIFDYPLSERLTSLKNKLYLGLKRGALERVSKVKNPKSRTISLKKDADFKNYARVIIRNITSNSNAFTTHFNFETCACLDPQILKQLIDYKEFKEDSILTELQSYKKLRGLTLEYLSYLNKTPFDKNKIKRRINYYYPRTIFGFRDSEGIMTINDARRDFKENALHAKLMSPKESADFITFEKLSQIKQIKLQPFDNPNLERVYYSVSNSKENGLEAVMEQMDANDIYDSSPEDLLRIGFYSNEQYLKIKKKNSKNLI
uniref:hypothetical protein n=1 Tax=Candidatus Ventrenecus sp. TaxID=3085654 RepID=UPI004028D4D8